MDQPNPPTITDAPSPSPETHSGSKTANPVDSQLHLTVAVERNSAAHLELTTCPECPNVEYTGINDHGQFVLELPATDWIEPSTGQSGTDAVASFDGLFRVRNHGRNHIAVWIEPAIDTGMESDAPEARTNMVSFFAGLDGTNQIDRECPAILEPGNDMDVGVTVESHNEEPSVLDGQSHFLVHASRDRTSNAQPGLVCNQTKATRYSSIQEAIDHASSNDTLKVFGQAGPYRESVEIHTSVELNGVGMPTIQGTIECSVEGTTIDGIRIAPRKTYFDQVSGILASAGNTTIRNCLIEGIDAKATDTGFPVHGIRIVNEAVAREPLKDIVIEHNQVRNIESVGTTEVYGGAIGITLQGKLDTVDVLDNTIEGIHSAGWAVGSVLLPPVSETSRENAPQNVLIEGNTFDRINNGDRYNHRKTPRIAAPWPGTAVCIEESSPGAADGNADAVRVFRNHFFDVPRGIKNSDGTGTLDAQYNWWGDEGGPGDIYIREDVTVSRENSEGSTIHNFYLDSATEFYPWDITPE